MGESHGGVVSSPSKLTRVVGFAIVGLLWLGSLTVGFGMASVVHAGSEPVEVRVATLLRDNNMGWVVARLEDVYFRFIDRPPVGGEPTISADFGVDEVMIEEADLEPAVRAPQPPIPEPLPTPAPTPTSTLPAATGLTPPPPVLTPAQDVQPKEGVWQRVGKKGDRSVYVTRVRADDIHTSVYASLMWIDTSRTKAVFIPGFEEPAGGPSPTRGQLPPELHKAVRASTNGGFRLADSLGGYYFEGTTVKPLVKGKASAVFFRDGTLQIGAWGRDFNMSDDIVAVRQNLDLIVDKGVSKVSSATDNIVWGATTDKESLTWRAAIGERPDGSLIYVVGPYMSAKGLGDTLVRAGVERAMVVDMNKYWAAGFFYRHDAKGRPQCTKLHPEIPDTCDRFLKPFKRDTFHFLATN